MRCATCRKLRAFRRCSCVQQRQLVEEETMAAVVEDGEPVPVGREEEDVESALLATAGRIPDAVLASPEKSMVENELADGLAGLDVRGKANEEATAAENKEVFEFGKSGKQDGGEESGSESHFSFVMKEESPKHTQAEQSSEEVVEQVGWSDCDALECSNFSCNPRKFPNYSYSRSARRRTRPQPEQEPLTGPRAPLQEQSAPPDCPRRSHQRKHIRFLIQPTVFSST